MNTIVDKVKEIVSRFRGLKTDLKTALTDMGVTVSTDVKLRDYPALITTITTGNDTSDATATAADIKQGATAYIVEGKVDGSMPNVSLTQTDVLTVSIGEGYSKESSYTLKDNNLIPEFVKYGDTIFGVTGTFTGDANATADTILTGHWAYVKGAMIDGQMPWSTIEKTGELTVSISKGYTGESTDFTFVDDNLIADNVKDGVTIFGVTGTLLEAPEVVVSGREPENPVDGMIWIKPLNPTFLYAWGSNTFGMLGTGDTIDRVIPVQVGTRQWSVVSCGHAHSMALDTNGYLYTWGYNDEGQLGLGDIGSPDTDRHEPTQVGNKTWSAISGGDRHCLALDKKGYLYGWGYDSSGELGLGTDPEAAYEAKCITIPTQVGDKLWKMVSGGYDYTLAIDIDGYLYSCGVNGHGQLGLGDKDINRNTLTQVGTKQWKSVSAGEMHSVALDVDGYLYTWGDHGTGRLGLGTDIQGNVLVPTKVGTKTWSMISGGGYAPNTYTLAIDTEGYLYAWGSNQWGECGINPDETGVIVVYEPTQIGDKQWTYVNGTRQGAFAIDADGYLYAWGRNDSGQLGLGDTTSRYDPTKVGDKKWKSVSCGISHTLALHLDEE